MTVLAETLIIIGVFSLFMTYLGSKLYYDI